MYSSFAILVASSISISGCFESNMLWSIANQYPRLMLNPTVVTFGQAQKVVPLAKDIMLFKEKWNMVKALEYSRANNDSTFINDNGSVIANPSNVDSLLALLSLIDKINLGTRFPVVVCIPSESMLKLVNRVRIDQEVLFMNTENMKMYEVYQIGNQLVIRILGHYDANSTLFLMDSSSIVRRRSNFHGKHLIGLSDHEPPDTFLDPAFKTNAMFHPGNQTYDITAFMIRGRYVELLQRLSDELNFTYSIYKRQDGVWGSGVGGKATGKLLDLVEGRADIIIGGLAMILTRQPFVRNLIPVSENTVALFIKRDFGETFTWTAFLEPFSQELWVAIISLGILFGTCFAIANASPEERVQVKNNIYKQTNALVENI